MVKIIDLGFCPRCKSDTGDMMTKVVKGVKFCWLCGCDVEEDSMELDRWVRWAKSYAENMV
jgi:uncharacterized protein (DUF983 family)